MEKRDISPLRWLEPIPAPAEEPASPCDAEEQEHETLIDELEGHLDELKTELSNLEAEEPDYEFSDAHYEWEDRMAELQAEIDDVEDELVALSLASEKVIIDMDEASYISNAMIRAFLELQHLMDAKNGELVLKGLSDEVFSVFEDMGVEDVFMIERK